MTIKTIKHKPQSNSNPKFAKNLAKLESLLAELQAKALPDGMINYINSEIDGLNASNTLNPKLHRQVYNLQQRLLKRLEKDLKMVPKGYYQGLWMVLGMSVFGLPLGVAFGSAQGNMGLLGVGLPIGMAIGIGVGTTMDAKAAKEGRQLKFRGYGV